jgi:hypothetical protein
MRRLIWWLLPPWSAKRDALAQNRLVAVVEVQHREHGYRESDDVLPDAERALCETCGGTHTRPPAPVQAPLIPAPEPTSPPIISTQEQHS